MATVLKKINTYVAIFSLILLASYPLVSSAAAKVVNGYTYYDDGSVNVPANNNIGAQQGRYDLSTGKEIRIATDKNGQYNSYFTGGGNNGSNNGSAAGSAAGNAVGCGAGQILAGIVRNGVSTIVGSIKGTVVSKVVNKVTAITDVPVYESRVSENTKAVRDDTAKTTGKEVGGGNASLTGGAAGLFDFPSWDSIGFCLANAAVHYVAQSTINWINSGFNGSPTFIQNPEQFFMDAADQEAGGLIQELGLGFMCTGIAPKVRIALVNDWNNKTGGANSFQKRSQCTLTNAINNVDRVSQSLSNGQLGDFVEYVGNPANRASSQFLMSQDELNRRVTARQGTLNFELRTSDFLPFKKCQTLPTGNAGQTKQVCNTYSPGTVIQNQLESTLNLPKGRLAIADEFDEVITSLINQLIKTALDQSLDPVQGAYGSDASNSDNSDNGDNGDNNDSGTPSFPNIPAPIKLKASCVASATSTVVGQPITLSINATGATNKGLIFSWQGIEGTTATTTEPSLDIEFTEPTPSSVISVLVQSGSKKTTAICPSVEVKTPEPLVVSCAPDKTSAVVGEPVNWIANFTGGIGTYSLTWAGSDELKDQTTNPAVAVYSDDGRMSGSVTVVSGSQTVTEACTNKVRVRVQ